MKARAVVFTAPGTVEFAQVDCPDPGPDEAIIRVTHSWISNGTEGSYLRGERIAGDTARRTGDPYPFPIVAGYQKIGIVEQIGADIDDLEPGETVFAAMGRVEGMFEARGGQVSPSVSSRDQIWKLPDRVDPQACSGLVLTQVGYNCGIRAPVQVGEGAIVIGDGMVGNWAAQTLSWRGARVLLVGRHDQRLEKLPASPLHHVVNASDGDWTQVARDLFPGGVAVAVDTVGSIAAVEQSMPLMQRYGHIVSAGFYGTEDRLALQPPRNGELSIDLVSGWSKERMDQTLALIAAGPLQTLPLITHHFPARQAVDAWRLLQTRDEPVLGVILDWQED